MKRKPVSKKSKAWVSSGFVKRELIEVVPSGKESLPSAEQVLYPSIAQALCRFSMDQTLDKPEIKNSVTAHKRREEFLLELDAQSLAELRKRIVTHWP